jgi:hypothetical protein
MVLKIIRANFRKNITTEYTEFHGVKHPKRLKTPCYSVVKIFWNYPALPEKILQG